MKTKVAMLISTAGVVVAGTAAALVNTQVLGSSTTSQPAVFADAPVTQPTVSVATTTTLPTTATLVIDPATTGTVDTSTSVASTPPSAAPSGSQAVYAIGNAGTVTLDTAGDVLTIVAVVPNGGWAVTKSENEDSTNVEIRLESGNAKVEFHANLLFGVVTTSVESDDVSVTSNSVDDSGGGGDDNSGPGGGGDSGGNSGHGGGGDD